MYLAERIAAAALNETGETRAVLLRDLSGFKHLLKPARLGVRGLEGALALKHIYPEEIVPRLERKGWRVVDASDADYPPAGGQGGGYQVDPGFEDAQDYVLVKTVGGQRAELNVMHGQRWGLASVLHGGPGTAEPWMESAPLAERIKMAMTVLSEAGAGMQARRRMRRKDNRSAWQMANVPSNVKRIRDKVAAKMDGVIEHKRGDTAGLTWQNLDASTVHNSTKVSVSADWIEMAHGDPSDFFDGREVDMMLSAEVDYPYNKGDRESFNADPRFWKWLLPNVYNIKWEMS